MHRIMHRVATMLLASKQNEERREGWQSNGPELELILVPVA
jgi:hypothetical protein